MPMVVLAEAEHCEVDVKLDKDTLIFACYARPVDAMGYRLLPSLYLYRYVGGKSGALGLLVRQSEQRHTYPA